MAPHLPMHGDGKLLARVFENLLTNAVRYGYDGQFVDMNGYVDNGEVVVQIMNYGDSIPEEDLPYLFDMFYTGDKARTENRGGTGLGLFIAKNIVEQLTVRFLLRQCIRTIFEVRLPKDENVTINKNLNFTHFLF
ncbi:sensor histidine kinase [Bacillus cereus]|uniref:sensor histidine kinase n=1 Tax=Bacillus cereus TaxID=1396 RepID=UPI003983A9CE